MRKEKPVQEFPAEVGLWEAEKIMFIFRAVKDRLDVDLWGSAMTGVNPNSGYSWVWSEDVPVSFYMPISCELKHDEVYVLWSDPEDGEEFEAELTQFTSLDEICEWIEICEKEKAARDE